MVLERNIVLNVKQSAAIDTGIEVTQGDYGTIIFYFRVKDDDAYIMDALRARVVFSLSDGTIVEGEANIKSGTYVYTFMGNELSAPGKVTAMLTLEYGSGRVSSCGFLFNVRYNPLFDKRIPAGVYISTLENIIDQAKGQLEYLQQLINVLQSSIGATALTRTDLIDNFLSTKAGIGALDAAAGKRLYDQISKVGSDTETNTSAVAALNGNIAKTTYTFSGNADYVSTQYCQFRGIGKILVLYMYINLTISNTAGEKTIGTISKSGTSIQLDHTYIQVVTLANGVVAKLRIGADGTIVLYDLPSAISAVPLLHTISVVLS